MMTLLKRVDAEYKKISKYLNESKDQGLQKKQYFNGTFEYCDAILEKDLNCTCKLCRTNISLTQLHGGKEFVKESQLLVFSQHYKLNDSKLPSLLQKENGLIEMKKLKDIESHPISSCPYYGSNDSHLIQEHNLTFDGNIGSGVSLFQNQIFGLKTVYAKGDCGFLSLWIALMSGEKSLKQKYVRKLNAYIALIYNKTSAENFILHLKRALIDLQVAKKNITNKKIRLSRSLQSGRPCFCPSSID